MSDVNKGSFPVWLKELFPNIKLYKRKARVECVFQKGPAGQLLLLCVHACVYADAYGVCPCVCGVCRCVFIGFGLHLCLCVYACGMYMHLCVVCTIRSGMDWSSLNQRFSKKLPTIIHWPEKEAQVEVHWKNLKLKYQGLEDQGRIRTSETGKEDIRRKTYQDQTGGASLLKDIRY